MKLKGADLLSLGGIVLTLTATVVGKIADKKDLQKQVAEEVAKHISK